MTTITIRGLDEDVQRRLKVRAAEHNSSMEAEVRAILTDAVEQPENLVSALLNVPESARIEELPIPPRQTPHWRCATRRTSKGSASS